MAAANPKALWSVYLSHKELKRNYRTNTTEYVLAEDISSALQLVMTKYLDAEPRIYSVQHQGTATIEDR